MTEIENLYLSQQKVKKALSSKIESLQECLLHYILTCITCFTDPKKYKIEESREFWESDTYSLIIQCQKNTISWVLDYFIKVMTSGDQSKKCYGMTLKYLMSECKKFFDCSELSAKAEHTNSKILFTQALVIASLNVILPEENADISSGVKLVFIDILKDYGNDLFEAYSKFQPLERNEKYGIRANKF